MVSRGWGVGGGSVVGRGGMSVSFLGLWGVDSSSGVGDLSYESVVMISGVGGGLDTTVGKSDGERSSNISFGILGLGLVEVGLAVVIGYSVFIGVWLRGKFDLLVRGGVVGWRRGTVCWGVISDG